MSYINQALRKAQETKESPYTPYRRFIATGDGGTGAFSRKVAWGFGGGILLLVAVSFMVFVYLAPVVGDKAPVPAVPEIAAVPPPPTLPPPQESPEIKALFEQAIAAQRLRSFSEAERIYGQILAVLPNHKMSLNNLGVLFLEQGDYAQARQFLERAMAADPAWADPRYNLACLLGRQGRPREGLTYLQQAAALSPAALDWAARDEDLQSIRLLPEYEKMLNR